MKLLNPSQRARVRWIFVGSTGIRAGWSMLIFLALLAIPTAIVGAIAHLMHVTPPKNQVPLLKPWLLVLSEAISLALVLGVTAIMARIERRSFLSYGLRARHAALQFAAGAGGGLACLSMLVAVLAAGGYLVFDGVALHGLAILGYGLIWALGFTLVGLFEELVFRGYPQYTLARGVGFWPASLIMSLLFGAAHLPNHGESALGLTGVVAAGLVFCLLLRITGSLWPGIGFHAAWDWAQSYLYGTADSGMLAQGHLFITHATGNAQLSGGTAGPEGSILSAPVMIIGLLALVWVCRRAGFVAPAVT